MSLDWIYTFVYLAWLGGAACFVLGLHQMNSPATARNGNRLSAAGMTVAVAATLDLARRPTGRAQRDVLGDHRRRLRDRRRGRACTWPGP